MLRSAWKHPTHYHQGNVNPPPGILQDGRPGSGYQTRLKEPLLIPAGRERESRHRAVPCYGPWCPAEEAVCGLTHEAPPPTAG